MSPVLYLISCRIGVTEDGAGVLLPASVITKLRLAQGSPHHVVPRTAAATTVPALASEASHHVGVQLGPLVHLPSSQTWNLGHAITVNPSERHRRIRGLPRLHSLLF